ncbi:MAG: T9SS type A sorting domain-containing protein, partial [Bacteroidota bacterium]
NVLEDQLQVDCYPNPFRDKLNVVLAPETKQRELVVSVINNNGQVVHSQQINSLRAGEHTVHLNFETKDISGTEYFYLRVHNESGVIIKKILRLK